MTSIMMLSRARSTLLGLFLPQAAMSSHVLSVTQPVRSPSAGSSMVVSVRCFHATAPVLAKGGGKVTKPNKVDTNKKKKGKGAANDSDDDDDDGAPAPVVLPDVSAYSSKMTKSIDRLSEDFQKMRGGAVRSDMFNHLNVIIGEGSSKLTNILELAQITMVNPLRFDISVFDPALTQAVGNAIKDCGMGLNPVKGERDNIWTIKVTKPSGEARDALIKVASARCERTRLDIRGIRKDGIDKLKNLKGKAGDDDLKRLTKQIEDLSDKALDTASKLLKAKETELKG